MIEAGIAPGQGACPWMPIEDTTREIMAEIVGAVPQEVVCMNTLSVNLHLGMAAFYRPTPKRYKILVEARCFPSDDYAVQSQVELHGRTPEEALIYLSQRPGEHYWRTEDILRSE
jgi:kynureninase